MNKNPFFIGEKVYLVPIESKYIDIYLNKLQSGSYDSNLYTGSKNMITKSALASYVERIEKDSERLDLFIVETETNEIVGEVVLNEIDLNNRSGNIRISIFIDKDFNQGYGTEAMKLVMDYGFGMLNLNRIELEVYSFNARAIHVYTKLGFKKEGVKRQCLYFNHAYHDAHIMSILAEEYKTSPITTLVGE